MAPERSEGILVPVGESVTLRETVAYAVDEAEAAIGEGSETVSSPGAGTAEDAADNTTREPAAGESSGDPAGSVALHFVYPASWRALDPTTERRAERAQQLLDRVAIWVCEDLGIGASDAPENWDTEDAEPIERAGLTVETALIGTEEYLFSPGDFARVLGRYARENGLERVIIDPEYEPAGSAPMLRPLEFELGGMDLAVEEAPVERPTRRGRLSSPGSALRFIGVFGLAYAFYLALGGFAVTDSYELATGALSAAIVAGLTWRVTVRHSVDPLDAAKRLARFAIYLPYLLWKIAKANVAIAYVVLHPRLPIDPRMVRFEAAVFGDLSVTTLANSITLTPGTLTVDAAQRDFQVHALTADSRAELLDGALERAVRFVFYGRAGARIPSPIERTANATRAGSAGAGDGDTDSHDGTERREGAA